MELIDAGTDILIEAELVLKPIFLRKVMETSLNFHTIQIDIKHTK